MLSGTVTVNTTVAALPELPRIIAGSCPGTGMMPSNAKSATRNDVNYVASFSGAMASTPSDASVDEMLPGDLETARLFGARVAEVAARYSVA
mgnify:CR=1 FL=1